MPPIADDLPRFLTSINRAGDYFATGTVTLLAPSMSVAGVGPIALPILPAQGQQLVAVAELAPYGKGPDTLRDASVRNCWQIEPARVRIGGRHWPQTLQAILDQAMAGLGVTGTVEAEFYKMLIYETGSFFVSHRDTEKSAGMFATLVIVLPSPASGGELIVRHKGHETRLNLSGEDPAEASFAAFYADCVHEVLPVTDGYRVTLVYNLVKRGPGETPAPPEYGTEQGRVVEALRAWVDAPPDDDEPRKIIHLLEHAYTQAELGFTALKGADAAVALVLTAAAKQSGCDIHLALMTIEESGGAEYSEDYRPKRRWASADDEDGEFEVGEVEDRSVLLSDWRRLDDQPSPLGEIPAEDEEFAPPEVLESLEPDHVHFQEATGNAGATFERTYQRAAIVLWPSNRIFDVLSQAGLDTTAPYLDDLVAKSLSGAPETRKSFHAQALRLARIMTADWPVSDWRGIDRSEPTDEKVMLSILVRLQDQDCIATFIGRVVIGGRYQISDNDALMAALTLLPPDTAVALIQRLVQHLAVDKYEACTGLLLRSLTPALLQYRDSLKQAALALIRALPSDTRTKEGLRAWPRRLSVEPGFVVDLLRCLDGIDPPLAERALRHMLATPSPFDIDTVLLPAALALSPPGFAAARRLRDTCLAHLRARIALPLAPPSDWARDDALDCRCAKCLTLVLFLAAPGQRTWTFRAAAADREHVEATIKRSNCDVDTKTVTKGRPYSLVCTKNQASHDRRARQRVADLEAEARLAG